MVSLVIYKSVGVLRLSRFSDRTHRACVRSQVTYADVWHKTWRVEAKVGLDAGLSLVSMDLTRLVGVLLLGELSGNDLTLGS